MSADDTLIWVDGKRSACLPLPDRGLLFGDGLFETLLLIDRQPVLLPFHLARLETGLERLGFASIPALRTAANDAISIACAEAPAGAASLRLTVTRGAGPRGYLPPPEPKPRMVVQVTALERNPWDWPAPARLGQVTMAWSEQPALTGVKHLNRLDQVLAAGECARGGWDEALMCNQAGDVVSVIAGNLFAVSGGRLLTAPIMGAGIAGTRRRAVIERWAPALGRTVDEATLSLSLLDQSDEVFFCNALIGIRAVGRLAGLRDRHWHAHPVAQSLHEQACLDYRRAVEEPGLA